ncbi:MAG: sigma-70 family RNA polymerase sigma factor [Firmicutes bacterium]|nr:sigma-70 family RNA polymerase sigma factor [Bacillota bacterium]
MLTAVDPVDLEKAMAAYLKDSSEDNFRQVVEAGTKLVHYFAGIYAPGYPRDDVLQTGFEGLVKAVRRYDPARGVAFATYAGHWIMGEIRHFARKEASCRRPGWAVELQGKVDRYIEKTLNETGKIPSAAQIAAALNVREEGLLQVMRAGWVSIDEIDIAKIQSQRFESFQLPIEDRIVLEQALDRLSGLQRKVIEMLFYRDMTQVEAASELGINQRRVSRILHKSLKLMNGFLTGFNNK